MTRALAVVALALAAGCADIRVGLKASADHVADLVRAASNPAVPADELRETVIWKGNRALRWDKAMLEHMGAPPVPVEVPSGPADVTACDEEDLALAQYRAAVARDRALWNFVAPFLPGGGGLWGQVAAWVGGGGLASIAGLFAKRKLDGVLADRASAKARADSAGAVAAEAMAALDEVKAAHPEAVKAACDAEKRPALRVGYVAREQNGGAPPAG